MASQILIYSNQIQRRLKELAEEINSKFNEVTLLVTLTGGVYTAIDLSKYITIPVKLEFVKVSSYGHEKEAGIVELKYMSASKGTNLGNVLIVDDIYDTGNTMDFLIKFIKNNYSTTSINTLVLLDKPEKHQKQLDIDFVGFKIPDKFVYGYGLDDKDYERNHLDIVFKE